MTDRKVFLEMEQYISICESIKLPSLASKIEEFQSDVNKLPLSDVVLLWGLFKGVNKVEAQLIHSTQLIC